MTGPDPAEYGWWLASRAAGVLALLCITVSVGLGLAMAGRVSGAPRLQRVLLAVHQQTALVGLVAVAVHGITLLGDGYLKPGIVGIAVPFVIDHAPLWTGLGVTAGWMAAILGLSYWVRHRIGPARWRKLHRATVLVYVLSVAHAVGAGTDASEAWMRLLLVGSGAPVLFLFVMRILPAPRPPRVRPGSGFRALRVVAVTPESASVTSYALEAVDGRPLEPFAAGQFVAVAVEVPSLGRQVRTYSLSSAPDTHRYRISVKREPDGIVSRHLHAAVAPGDVLDVAPPRGAFVLGQRSHRPVVLVSAGVGATPVLAMLATLAHERSTREVWWVHGARCGAEHAFRAEVRDLVARLPSARAHVRYSRPQPGDLAGRDYDAEGRLSAEVLLALGVPRDADFHICGPRALLDDLTSGLRAAGVAAECLHGETFGPGDAATPRAGSPPASEADVRFSRSGLSVRWDERFASLLELAEASDVHAQSSCRAGVCHACATPLLAGRVHHTPDPPATPPDGQVLLCCARPDGGDVVLDL